MSGIWEVWAISYTNVRCNVLFTEIRDVKLVRRFKHRLLSQARLEISVVRNVHWIDNISFRSAQAAYAYIAEQSAISKTDSYGKAKK